MALAFAANLKRVLQPARRVLAVLARILCAGAVIVSVLFVMSIAEAGAGPPWWAVPLALCLIGVCAMAAVTGVRAFRRGRAPLAPSAPNLRHPRHRTHCTHLA